MSAKAYFKAWKPKSKRERKTISSRGSAALCCTPRISQTSLLRRARIFPVARLIAEWSAGMTLFPGDILLTGTPSGVGIGRKPPEFLKPGDIVEAEIEGIGVLRNTVGA